MEPCQNQPRGPAKARHCLTVSAPRTERPIEGSTIKGSSERRCFRFTWRNLRSRRPAAAGVAHNKFHWQNHLLSGFRQFGVIGEPVEQQVGGDPAELVRGLSDYGQ